MESIWFESLEIPDTRVKKTKLNQNLVIVKGSLFYKTKLNIQKF